MPTPDGRSPPKIPVVGIGASAGGVEALRHFFAAVPTDLGLAYVVVVHLAPDRESELPEILGRQTSMPVHQVGDHQIVDLAPDQVYVIAPGRKLQLTNGSVGASAFEEPRGKRSAIDLFFRSLADVHGDGFAIVLSGSGTDGALGAKAVKEAGGLVLVQDPTEATHDGMPRAAISTGAADIVLPVQDLVTRLVELTRGKEHVAPLLWPTEAAQGLDEASSRALKRVLELLRSRTGHDFSKYKRNTVLRRLARRIQLSHRSGIADYLTYLREHAEEVRALFDDLLISVTTFFRDPEAWGALQEHVIASLVERTAADEQIRIWVPACATGEEAFSLAVAFEEELVRRQMHRDLVVFASDVDESALAFAREGLYPETIRADVSETRLERFFSVEDDHFRVTRELRDRVVFAAHSLLRDPPFSRMHLISCRNFLIYLDREMQEQVMSVFRYALREGGHLFLGASETADAELFAAVDKKHRIFAVRKPGDGTRLPLPDLLATPRGSTEEKTREPRAFPRLSAGEMHGDALEELAPPTLLVDERWNVLHLSPSVGRFLEQGGGPPARKATELVRPELREDLHATLHRAFEGSEPQLSHFASVAFNGARRKIAMLVQKRPQRANAPAQALITFLDAGHSDANGDVAPEEPSAEVVRSLRDRLRQAEHRIERMRDDHHLTNEDLRAANEELQSLNEEYRSTTEELETSKEELQSINEELHTVNNELKVKLEEVSRAHSDIENLMAATDVAILFLDPELRINRFTPRLSDIFKVKVRDQDRPIGDVKHTLDYDDLDVDARRVLQDLQPIEREARSTQGRVYMVRLSAYRVTGSETADGVVVTFIDVTAIKNAEAALRESERRLATELKVMRRLHDMTLVAATSPNLQVALDEILETAIDLHHADLGNIQLLVREGLRIYAQRGFTAAFLQTFDSIDASDDSASGRAFRSRETCRIEDVTTDPGYAPHRSIAAEAGYRAVQSIPLIDRTGALVGVLSVHFRDAHVFSERDKHIGDLLARQAADLIATRAHQDKVARLNDELKQRTAELADQDRNKEAFLATLGHELRNPMAAIASSLELVSADDGATRRALEVLRRQSQHMVRLINDLLDITRVNHGKLELQREIIDISQCAREAGETARPLLEGKGLELVLEVPAEPIWIDADPERMMQILGNLLRNATTYTEQGRIVLRVRKELEHAHVTVADTGMGIDGAEGTNLFDPFTQVDRGRRSGGLGLGLALVKRLVEMHGGTVGFQSDGHGAGSEFTFTVPLSETAATPAPIRILPKLAQHRILVVDDQPDVADMLAALLEALGQDVRVAYDGTEALVVARKQRPDLAILDLSMPDMDGRELARLLRQDFPPADLTLVALTGYWRQSDAPNSDFTHHLLKPASLDRITELLSSLSREA